jgi:hypothetical protein
MVPLHRRDIEHPASYADGNRRGCGGTECVEMVSIPYPTKALIQELFSLGIDLRLELK